MSKPIFVIVGIFMALFVVNGAAWGQAPYPSRPVTLIVPAAAGGVVDAVGRLVAKKLSDAWGQSVVIENLAGADGLIATRRAAAAAPDGYTLLLQIPTVLLLKHSHKDVGDPMDVLAGVAEIAKTPSAIVVSSKLPVRSIKELATYCNGQPQPCTWGTGQALSYYYGRRFFAAANIPNLLNVPYKSSAPLMNDLAGGHITVANASVGGAIVQHQAGSLRILAMNSKLRHHQLPDVPTFKEAGIDVPARGSWIGLFAPIKTPPDVISRIERSVTALATDSTLRAPLSSAGAEPVFEGQRDFSETLKEEARFLDGMVRQYKVN